MLALHLTIFICLLMLVWVRALWTALTRTRIVSAPQTLRFTAAETPDLAARPRSDRTPERRVLTIPTSTMHSLPANTAQADRSLAHNHNLSGSCSVSVSGTCSVTSISVSTTISGSTTSVGSGTPFNVMQPWAAWNIMIKL